MLNAFAVIAGLSVTGSVMIFILLFAKRVLKKRHGVSRRAFVFLWLLIFLRMCIPFGVDVLQPEEVAVLPGQAVYSALSEQTEAPAAMEEVSVTGEASAAQPAEAQTPAPAETVAQPASLPDTFRGMIPMAVRLAAAVWLAGAIGAAGILAFSYFRKLREIRRLPGRGLPLVAHTALIYAKDQVGISHRRIQIRVQEGSGGAVYGIFRPTIVLGRDSLENAEMILTHECVHVRHWDNLLKAGAFAVLALHWFNPVVWIGFRSFCRDIEMACDEKVLRCIHEDSRKHYAVTILGVSQVRSGRMVLSNFGESPVAERVKHVLGIRRRQVAMPVIGLLLAVFLVLGCFASPVAAVSEKIAEYGGSLDSGFVDFAAVSEQDGEILDYTAYDGGSLFVVQDDSGVVKILEADSHGNRSLLTELSETDGAFIGAVYYSGGRLYYAMKMEDHIDLKSVDTATGATSDVIRVNDLNASMRLFGGSHYLCWYEESLLRVLDLQTGEILHTYQTNGNQDYGAMEEGYFAYQVTSDSKGTVRVRCVAPETGDSFEVTSLLGRDTCSVYGNSRFIIYKEEYKLGSECYIYDREKQTTARLVDFVEPEYVEELNTKQWGITLVGNRLLICGEGNAVYEVNLESGETVKHESGYSGVGFYHLKNSDGNVSAMLFTVQESRGLSGSGNLYVGRFMR